MTIDDLDKVLEYFFNKVPERQTALKILKGLTSLKKNIYIANLQIPKRITRNMDYQCREYFFISMQVLKRDRIIR